MLMSAPRYILHYDLPTSFEGTRFCHSVTIELYGIIACFSRILSRNRCAIHMPEWTVGHISYQSVTTTGRGGRDGQACTTGLVCSMQCVSNLPASRQSVFCSIVRRCRAPERRCRRVKRVTDAAHSPGGCCQSAQLGRRLTPEAVSPCRIHGRANAEPAGCQQPGVCEF